MCKRQIVSIGKACACVLALWIFCVLFLSACDTEKGTDAATMEEGMTETAEWAGTAETEEGTGMAETAGDISETITEVQKEPVEETESGKVLIDYPFPGVIKGYTLALVASKEQEGQYDLQVCNESGTVVQQFLCGVPAEPVTFRYDDLYYDTIPDLEIFSADRRSGVLFSYNLGYSADMADSKVFLEEAIEIPYYDESEENNMLVRTEDEDSVEKIIYQLNMGKKRVDEVRLWRAQKDTEMLTIWDCLEQKMIFEGRTKLDETGEPMNAEYYNFLLWDNIYYLFSGGSNDGSESGEISVWISGNRVSYADRQSLLEDFGLGNQKPTYQCYDCFGNPSLELYMNEQTETAWVIGHVYSFTGDMKKEEQLYVSSVDSIRDEVWEEPDPFSVKSVDGSDGADHVEDYEEILEYREDGKPDFFQSKGNITWLKDGKAEGKDILVQIDYIYRDDGTLYYRYYQHNSHVFGSTLCSRHSFYDEEGRILYEDGYITHGGLLYYYFYENNERKPKYSLMIDTGGGYYNTDMVRYRYS